MSTKLIRTLLVSTALAAGIVLLPTQALADTTTGTPPSKPQQAATQPPQGDQIEDIVVTAQKRTERLQDVPIAVTAITGEALERKGLTTTSDLNLLTPNLNVTRVPRTQVVYLRGIGQNSTSAGQEQNVGIYVDGVYYPAMTANVFSFNNVERIEVLRGPQGTLFGRNTTGGVVSITTKDPAREPSAYIEAGYGNYDTYTGSAYLTGGITDSLRADIAFQGTRQVRGWGRNITTGADVHNGYNYSIRSKIVFEPSADTKVVLTGGRFVSQSDLGTARMVLPNVTSTPAGYGGAMFNGNIYDTLNNDPSSDYTTQEFGSARIEQDLGFARLVNIAAYQHVHNFSRLDSDNVPAFRSRSVAQNDIRTYTEELQIQSEPDSKLKWVAGIYYFNNVDGSFPQSNITPCSTPGIGTCLADSTNVVATTAAIRTHSISGYAQATYPIFKATNLTLGIRYTSDNKRFYGVQANSLGVPIPFSTGVPDPFDQRHTWNNPTFRVGLDHHINDDVMIYGSISSGFKSGVYNANSPKDPPVSPETITDYEGGFKAELFDKHLRMNGAIFYYDYRNIQITKRDTPTTTVLQNAARARLYGAELEVEARLTSRFRLTANAAYLHATYTEFPAAAASIPAANNIDVAATVDASGNNLPRAPHATLSLGADYTVPVSFGSVSLSGQYYYNDGFFWESDNRLRQPAYSLTNASLRISDRNDRHSLLLWINNIFSTKYYSYEISSASNPDVGSPGAPRTYGVTFATRF